MIRLEDVPFLADAPEGVMLWQEKDASRYVMVEGKAYQVGEYGGQLVKRRRPDYEVDNVKSALVALDGYGVGGHLSDFGIDEKDILSVISMLQRDASRYRWISNLGSCPFAETDEVWGSPSRLDEAIDEQLATQLHRERT